MCATAVEEIVSPHLTYHGTRDGFASLVHYLHLWQAREDVGKHEKTRPQKTDKGMNGSTYEMRSLAPGSQVRWRKP
eukprot:1187677-Prorocentrum_minimum.AAC.1